jgi:Peptidase C13 family
MLRRIAIGMLGLLFACALPSAAQDGEGETLRARDLRLLDANLAALARQRPDRTDLYVVGFAGDGAEDVFRNEVEYLETLMTQRFDAKDRVVSLVNHVDSFTRPRPLATLDNLQRALAGIGQVMDRDEDLLLLFLTTHGTRDHELFLQLPPVFEATITPRQLRAALDASGIRNRVVVVSACYSGGFIPALHSADTLVLTAARRNRPSFGCGSDSTATYFGRAWMVDGLNRTTDFIAAFEDAKLRIAAQERAEDFRPSQPQIDIGEDIVPRLQRWQASFVPGAPVPYPYVDKTSADAAP